MITEVQLFMTKGWSKGYKMQATPQSVHSRHSSNDQTDNERVERQARAHEQKTSLTSKHAQQTNTPIPAMSPPQKKKKKQPQLYLLGQTNPCTFLYHHTPNSCTNPCTFLYQQTPVPSCPAWPGSSSALPLPHMCIWPWDDDSVSTSLPSPSASAATDTIKFETNRMTSMQYAWTQLIAQTTSTTKNGNEIHINKLFS